MKAIDLIQNIGRKGIPYLLVGSICLGAGAASKDEIDYAFSRHNSPRMSIAYMSKGAVVLNKDSGAQYPVMNDGLGLRIGSIEQRLESLEKEASDAQIVSAEGEKLLEGSQKIERKYFATSFSGKNAESGFLQDYLDLHKSVRLNSKGNIEVYLTDAKHTEKLTEDFQLGSQMYRLKGLYTENKATVLSVAGTVSSYVMKYVFGTQ